MKQGVTLIAIGRYGYLQWAINIACSLKFHSPGVPVQLIVGKPLWPDAQVAHSKYGLFDFITCIEESEYTEAGKLFPAKLKTDFYKHLIFDETIYLDVDGVIIKDITPLFSIKSNFASDVQGIYDLSHGEDFNCMKWAKPANVWFHFGLKATDKLPALNSSFVFIRKGALCESIFAKAKELLHTNPLPQELQWHPWGKARKTKINQPDELYFNVALAQLGITPEHAQAIHFRMANESGPYVSLTDLQANYYGIGLFGELRVNHQSLREHYNKHMRQCWQAVIGNKTGEPFSAKCEPLSQSKFVIQ